MAVAGRSEPKRRLLPNTVAHGLRRITFSTYGFVLIATSCAVWLALATWSVHDPSLNNATPVVPRNILGGWGAIVADLGIQSLGLATIFLFLPLAAWGWHLVVRRFRWTAAAAKLAAA
jgi:S-DNA-T family DNA segregation ATPase FtsK/SpoIIIE